MQRAMLASVTTTMITTLTNSLKGKQGVADLKIKVPKYILFAVELLER